MLILKGSTTAGALSAVTLLAAISTASHAAGTAAAGNRPDQTAAQSWMPDVAPRIADLRERTERATADARARRIEDLRAGQWWRVVAAAPRRPR